MSIDDQAAPMTDEELAEVEARLAAASQGPWKFYVPSEHEDDFRIAMAGPASRGAWNGGYVCRLTRSHSLPGQDGSKHPRVEDARFMAWARTDVPRLLAEVRRLRALLQAGEGDQPRAL